MQDKNNSQNGAAGGSAGKGAGADSAGAATAVSRAAQGDFIQKIVEKIKSSENILIALSRDPSVDEIAAALGLTMFLDGIQKHATAIYSGRTPDAVAFLQPNETFEKNTDSLQDFIIALNKDKADHLRYKLEGDFVKVFVTPYKSKITQEDLQFSYGDFNVDFVIAINVASAGNLDEALREHGRIMHDAAVVNITTGEPGRFGEIEWSNPVASSLCEMVTELIFTMQNPDEKPLERDIATALLTGIVAATDRFSNNRTNSDTMGVASKLMSMGADQQLISSNVSGNDVVHNEPGGMIDMPSAAGAASADLAEKKTNLTIEHDAPGGNGAGTSNAAGSAATMTVPAGALAGDLAGAMAGANSAGAGSANPAVQAAPSVSADGNASTSGMVSATNDVTPENVVVQPVIPGKNGVPVDQMVIPGASGSVNNGNGAGGAVNAAEAGAQTNGALTGQTQSSAAPTSVVNPGQMQIPGATANSVAAGADATENAVTGAVGGAMPPRPMATSAPEMPAVKQVGSTLQPPVTEKKKPKNYAEMMEEALSEGLPQDNTPAMDATTMNLPGVQSSGMVDAGATSTMAVPGVTPMPNAAPVMEPVANPMNGAILPPPPAPNVGGDSGMMPPVLPPVRGPLL